MNDNTYRRKPSEVIATQWYPTNDLDDLLITPSGTFVIRPGDWIVIANGCTWVVEQEVFDELYEKVS